MKKYLSREVESKWQKRWIEDELYLTDLDRVKDKYYILVELPYTSGDLHMGHWFVFTMGDVLARFKRAKKLNVVFPNGFDAFGLPAENAAIKRGIHPKDWTYSNAERMRQQFDTMGTAIDWTKTMISCDSKYYRWNQWIFLKLLEKGLAYKGKALASWCPNCQTVLAEENVEVGLCWRCGSEVEKKEIEQWFFKITAYADRLIWDNPPQTDWPKPLTDAQNKWIGKSQGLVIKFDSLEVFTTRPDTLFGATFVVISPEHPLLDKFVTHENKKEVEEYLALTAKKSEQERKENKEKTGVFSGSYIKNPINGEQIPVWIADYVLISYGTGAIMGVPAHDQRDFEFAKKFNLPIKEVIKGEKGSLPYEWEGKLIESGEYTGLDSVQAREKISKYIADNQLGEYKTTYHLHDWSISRQRYWGTPIPVVYCENCGMVPVPEKDLPIELPYNVDYAPKGKAPLASAEDWVKVDCPKCNGKAFRETETLDGFMDNSWYFYRYLDPKNQNEIFDKKIIDSWMPIDIYIGGAEHTYGHALYSRFFTKFFHDLGLVKFDEYSIRRIHHGVILGPDGHRMSKSRGNVVNPDEEVKKYGADTIRLYLMFLGPYDIVTPWNPEGVEGINRFLLRVWRLVDKVAERLNPNAKDLNIMHKTITKVSTELDDIRFNTAIAALMEWLNYLSKKEKVSKEEYRTYLLLLAPFAPHITEELWQILGEKYSIHQQFWPESDKKYLEEEEVTVIVQVNGKVRERLLIQKDILNNKEEVEKMAKNSPKVAKFLEGKVVKKSVYVQGKIVNFVI